MGDCGGCSSAEKAEETAERGEEREDEEEVDVAGEMLGASCPFVPCCSCRLGDSVLRARMREAPGSVGMEDGRKLVKRRDS